MGSELLIGFAGAVIGGFVSIATSVVMELWRSRRAARTALLLMIEPLMRADLILGETRQPSVAEAATAAQTVVDAWTTHQTPLIQGSTIREVADLVGDVHMLAELARLGRDRPFGAEDGRAYVAHVRDAVEQTRTATMARAGSETQR